MPAKHLLYFIAIKLESPSSKNASSAVYSAHSDWCVCWPISAISNLQPGVTATSWTILISLKATDQFLSNQIVSHWRPQNPSEKVHLSLLPTLFPELHFNLQCKLSGMRSCTVINLKTNTLLHHLIPMFFLCYIVNKFHFNGCQPYVFSTSALYALQKFLRRRYAYCWVYINRCISSIWFIIKPACS